MIDWPSLWWRICRPANAPMLPRWLAPKAWRRVDRAESHWLRANDRAARAYAERRATSR